MQSDSEQPFVNVSPEIDALAQKMAEVNALDWNRVAESELGAEVWLKFERLGAMLSRLKSPILAFSGGIDSALVAALLSRFSENPLAVTALSPSLSKRQMQFAKTTAFQIQIPHRLISTDEISDERYRANGKDRCFFCKTSLYDSLLAISNAYPGSRILSGTNFDDLSDYRPGLKAAHQFEVLHPLAGCRVRKSEVRAISKLIGLFQWDRPASPCLASRIAYGVAVTTDRLSMIEKAESLLWNLSFSDVRVRLFPDLEASVEVPKEELSKFQDPIFRENVVQRISDIGFKKVIIDPKGLRSGNLNQLLPLQKRPGKEMSPSSQEK